LADLFKEKEEPGFLNPAAQALRAEGVKWKDVDGNLPTSFLRPQEAELLANHLVAPLTAQNERGRWREARDRAMVGLCVGAGLKVQDIVGLTVNCITPQAAPWITLSYADSKFEHRTKPFDYAARALATWLHIRQQAGTEGDLVFPSDITPVIKNGRKITSINPSTVNRITEAVIVESGVKAIRDPEHRASPQTLRNTFAAELFERGETPALVAEWMGFAQPVSAERLYESWKLWRQTTKGTEQGE
jgi:integrase